MPANGLIVASTFAGAGGSSTGWAIAGYRVAWANEFHPPAADSYALNHPGTILDRRDIRQVKGAEIIEAIGAVPDVLDGSPPCQDFSMAGKRTRGWGEERSHGDGTHQRSDDLFGQYIRLVGEIRPRAFVAENVKGLVTGAAKGQFKRIMAGLTGQGYRVRAKVLDAQWLGVPQRRKRVIIIGIRDDLGVEPAFPLPLPYRYSMLDACPWLSSFEGVTDDSFDGEAQSIDDPAPTITTQAGRGVTHPRWELIGGFGFDAEHRGIGLDEPSPTIPAADSHRNRWQLRHNHTTGMKRTELDLDEPAITITASDSSNVALVRGGVEFRPGTNRSASGRVEDLDGPMGTITGQGALGMKHSEISVHLRHWGASGRAEVHDPLDNVAPTITDHPSRTVLRYDDHNFHRGHVDDLDDPASTIAASGIRGVGMTQALLDDGTEQRKLSIAEVKRLCSFPDDYVLTGSYADQWARLGNSVPPLMMAAVARAIAPILLGS